MCRGSGKYGERGIAEGEKAGGGGGGVDENCTYISG